MVVDDDEGFRTMIRTWLVEGGVNVVAEAPDGPEAVARGAEAHPDIVLMDLRMPKMDGIEAASRILASDPNVQVILLSAYGDASLKQAAEDAGVYTYLLKESPPDVLWRTIRFAWTYKLSLQHRGRAATS
jgi:DNA-binding NarL/FixJ family response regulator